MRTLIFLTLSVTLLACAAAFGASPALSVRRAAYHGWPDAVIIDNGKVEVIIVPAIGRVMQFRFAGESEGPFWENRELDGRKPDPSSKNWMNFGGDKPWPAPDSDWGKVTPRVWPPPAAFDAMPSKVILKADGVTMISAIDPHYGIRVTRHVRLEPADSVMTISTFYEKVNGQPVKAGIWIITQLREPAGVYLPVSQYSLFPGGCNLHNKVPPPSLKVSDGMISLLRDPHSDFKIGSDAGTLLWVGGTCALRIDVPRIPQAEYPDNGCSAKVYTNRDPLQYVELEMLGGLQQFSQGNTAELTCRYHLFRRTNLSPDTEARAVLAQ